MVRQQIWQIRNVLLAYQARFNTLPPDLETLARTTFTEPVTGKTIPFIEGIKFNKAGRVVDSLGYTYKYDPVRGTVASTAPCCNAW